MEIATVSMNGQKPENSAAVVAENQITYEDIYHQTDLSYIVGSEKIKEDIILHERPSNNDPLSLSFELNIPGMIIEQQADGELHLLDEENKETMFVIEKPFMLDSYKPEGFISRLETPVPEGSWTDDIEVTSYQKGNRWIVELRPSMEWLLSDERVYPVNIDPTVKIYQPKAELNDTTIRSGSPSTTGGADLELAAGLFKDSKSHNIVRSLIQFDMDALPKGAAIMNAQLNLRLSTEWNTTALPISLYESSSAWEENRATWLRRTQSALWNTDGGDFTNVKLDTQTVKELNPNLPEPELYKWRIPINTVQKWIDQPHRNLGLMLKADNETLATFKKFYSGDYTSKPEYSPKLTITYFPVSRLGLEKYWSYADHAVSDGSGFVNMGTGNLVLNFNDFSVAGRGNSGFAFTRTYNSKSTDDSAIGYRWSFKGNETITEFSNKDVLYMDADGTTHQFTYDQSTGAYKSPTGYYGTLHRAAYNAYEIKDFNGNRTVFRELKRNQELDGQMFFIEYEEDRNLNRIKYTRDSRGLLTSILDATGRALTFEYENDRIKLIEFERALIASYKYENGNLIEVRTFEDAKDTTVFPNKVPLQ